jgi:hypothetical protein
VTPPTKASSAESTEGRASRLRSFFRGAFAIRGASAGPGGSGAPSHRRTRSALILAALATTALILAVAPAAATAPVVTIEPASEVGFATAKAKGTVNPEEKYTYYHFEYATQAQFESSEWGEATQTGFGELETGNSALAVQTTLEGLAPGTTYHLRLLAANEDGEENAVAPSFETEAVAPPEAKELQVSAVTDHSAHFKGKVNSGGSGAGEKAGTYRFECEPSCPGIEAPREFQAEGFADGADHTVEANAEGLVPNQPYTVKLIARNAQTDATGSPAIAEEAFTTIAIAPSVTTEAAQDVGTSHASLQGLVNPHNSATVYWFEYGDSESYGASVPLTQDASAGHFNKVVAAMQPLYGLQPGTTYHFRLVADNGVGGQVHGEDKQFTTTTAPPPSTQRPFPGAGFLPDNRGWELVSPANKQGADVMIDSGRTRAAQVETASEPMAMTFASLGAFADVHGAAVGNDYMAIRTAQPGTQGWDTHGITPQMEPLNFFKIVHGMNSSWDDEFSPDLGQGVFMATTSPLTSAPNVADLANLYRRDDLRTPGAGSYQLLSDCPACSSPLPPPIDPRQLPRFAGASADFSHVIFESVYALTPDAPPTPSSCTDLNQGFGCEPHLYEWANGTLRLAGILPDSACGSPPCIAPESVAGRGASFHTYYTPHTISADGSRIVFTDISPADGGDADTMGNLYQRIDGSETVQINASEKTIPDAPQPAAYQDASTDGTRVFFTTGEQLTDQPAPDSPKLYMYDANAPAGEHLTLISAGHNAEDAPNGVQGVIGASADGHYVYFTSGGQLVAGQPALGSNVGLYEWHDGTTSYIGQEAGSDEIPDLLPGNWGLFPLEARVSPDGRHLLFVSSSGRGLTGYQQNDNDELYLYSADTHALQCASCNPSGAPANAGARVFQRILKGASGSSSYKNHPLSLDGSRVFFSTAERMVPEDTDGSTDVYEFDSASATLHLISSGESKEDSWFMDASPDGKDVFFTTAEKLTGWDFDGNRDLYDARVGGGLPEPPPPPPSCQGDACQPPPVLLNDPTPASAGFSGPGNPKASFKKRHRKRKRHHARHAHKARANHNRGGAK